VVVEEDGMATGPRGVGDIDVAGSFLRGRVPGAIECRFDMVVEEVIPGSLVAATAPGRDGLGADAVGRDVFVPVMVRLTGETVVPFVRVVKIGCAFAFEWSGGARVAVVVSLDFGDCLGVADVDFSVTAGCSGGGKF